MKALADLLSLPGSEYAVGDGLEEQLKFCETRAWTDGLPVIPPTRERVEGMLAYYDCPLDQAIAKIPPRYGAATPLRLAANAVMAGCRPEYFPVVALAVEAMCEASFNLYAVQTTTHSCAPLVFLNGPVSRELGIDSGHKAFGPGAKANATIGRAVRLALINIGGAIPGTADMSTYGSPAKFSYCAAENENANPWEPLHVARGYDNATSTVSVFAAEAPHNVSDHASVSAQGILRTIAGTAATTGANSVYHAPAEALVLLSPEHAATIADDGFSKRDVQQFLFQHARVPIGKFSGENIEERLKVKWGELYRAAKADAQVPIAQSPEHFVIAVVGGAGKHSAFLPSFGNTSSVTKPLINVKGKPVMSIQELKTQW